MTDPHLEPVQLTWEVADALWRAWAPTDDDILARAAYDRILRVAAGIDDDGLYFRPGGWTIDLPAVTVRIACVAALLAASFQIAGLEDVDREIIIATAGLVSAMNVRPIDVDGNTQYLLERIRAKSLDGTPMTPESARGALPRSERRRITRGEIRDALNQLVAAGLADRQGDDYIIRAEGEEAWLRLTFDSG